MEGVQLLSLRLETRRRHHSYKLKGLDLEELPKLLKNIGRQDLALCVWLAQVLVMIGLEGVKTGQSSVLSAQGLTKQKIISVALLDVQLKKGRSAYMLC